MVTSPVTSLREPFDGGTESFVVGLANELVAMGHTVDIVAKEAEEQNLFQRIEFSESPMSMKDAVHSEWVGQNTYRALQLGLIDPSRYDVIHYNSFMEEILDAGSLLKMPSVLTLHLPLQPKFAVMYGLFAKRMNATCVAVSSRVYDQWKNEITSPIEIIPNGIATESWRTKKQNGEYLVWSGRISKEKNPRDAIKIAKKTGVPLRIIGKVSDQEYFDEMIAPELSENIVYKGHISHDELKQLAVRAHTYLATATWDEPFGLSVLEMLSAGVPVVGYESAIPPELRHENVSRVAQTGNWQDLAARIASPQTITADECYDFAKRFSLQQMARSYCEVYKKAAKI